MDLVSGAMGSLAPKLIQLLQDEYQLEKHLRSEVKSLSEELESIYAFLHKVAQVPWYNLDKQIKIWAREVRCASFDMEDVLDTLLVQAKSHDHADQSRLKHAMKKMGDLFTKAKARHDIASDIKTIKEHVKVVAERRQRYKIDDNIEARTTTTIIDPRLLALYKEASQLIGIDEPMDAVIEMLSVGNRHHSTSGKETKIVSIVGFGGLGKTTLAKAVYDKVNNQFDCCACVQVGQNPDLRKVLRDILIDLKPTNMTRAHVEKQLSFGYLKEFDERQLINELRLYLQGKRYFIVVDDIWQTSAWEVISCAFVDGNCGSRILTTTRNSQVSTEIDGEIYRMEELSYNNSRKLFYAKTFGGEERGPSSDELDNEVCETIIQKCRGVPLAIVTIAGALARKPTKEWSHLNNSIGFSSDDDKVENMKKILSFSCYDLPSHLRTCFLYLCVFPEEYFIEKNDLIFRWIDEGFIHVENGKDIFNVGCSYLDELINRNVLIPVEDKDSGLLKGCHVHDMLLRVIRQISNEEDFIVALDRKQRFTGGQGNVRRLSLQMLETETNYKDMGRVRSFYAIICFTKLIPPVSGFNVLRVLVLEFVIGMDNYPIEHIAKLLHLRYIGLSHTPVSKLPKQIGCLKFLQTLLLDDTGIKELPASVRLLKQLMCLRVDVNTRVPDWIGEMTSLLELEIYHDVVPDFVIEAFRVGEVERHRGVDNKCSTRRFVKELGNLTNLRVLKTAITLQDKGQGRDFLQSLRKLNNIQDISVILPSEFIEVDVIPEPGFALSSSLRILELLNLEFSKLPEWMNGEYLPNLCQLKVVVTNVEEKDLRNLATLPKLQDLALVAIRNHRLKLTICGCGGFQNLRLLRLTAPLQFVQGSMPKLEKLTFPMTVFELKDANISFDLGLENLSSLQSLIVSIDCADACAMEVKEAEAAIQHAVDIHPNHLALSLTREKEDKMGTVDAGSRLFSRRMYQILKETTLNEQIKKLNEQIQVLNNCNSALYSHAQEIARLLPEDHPSIAKIQWTSVSMLEMEILRKQLVDSFERMNDTSDPNELMLYIKDQERLLVLYNNENKRMDSIIKEELKAVFKNSGNDPKAKEEGE